MAYDANDPADKAIVQGLIAAALEEQATAHETDIKGLKDKNKELIGRIKANDGVDPAELQRLQTEVETTQTALKEAQTNLKKTSKERDDLKTNFDNESKYTTDLLIDNALTFELTANKVAAEYMPAAKALLRSNLAVKVEGNERKVMYGDKPVTDAIKEWSQGDSGKIFVSAQVNGGSGGNGAPRVPGSTGKTMTRAAYEAASANGGVGNFFAEGGLVVDS